MGAARADGRGRSLASGCFARRALSHADAGQGRSLAGGTLHRHRFPARVLSALSRLSKVFPALGALTLPAATAKQRAFRVRDVRGGVFAPASYPAKAGYPALT